MAQELALADKKVSLDKEGYLENLADWSPEVATALATKEQIALTSEHWEVIHLLRNFYEEHDLSPMMRILVKQMRETYGSTKGNSLYLMQLFPEYPALKASKIAGLPRPTNCP
jgi:tRNA 2-thiouridine synthesizing protein E